MKYGAGHNMLVTLGYKKGKAAELLLWGEWLLKIDDRRYRLKKLREAKKKKRGKD